MIKYLNAASAVLANEIAKWPHFHTRRLQQLEKRGPDGVRGKLSGARGRVWTRPRQGPA